MKRPGPDWYKAWVLFAPVWFKDEPPNGCTLRPRWSLAKPVCWLVFALCELIFFPAFSLINPKAQLAWPIKVTDPAWPGGDGMNRPHFFNNRAAYWCHPWHDSPFSLALLVGHTWGIGLVVHEWGVRLLLGWWQMCWHLRSRRVKS